MTHIAQLAPAQPSLTDQLAAFCKATGDALRLDILRALRNDSFGVLELAQIFAMRQSGMSHHLKVLANAGLVSTRREGNSIFYRRSLPDTTSHWSQLHETLLCGLDVLPLGAELQPARQLAIEIGPGEGGFLPDLAARFERVIGLDNAPSMLERARQQCTDAGLDNVQCLLADALDPQCPVQPADCVVSNMVLHHMPAPAEAMKRFTRLLKPGGSLILTELCSHDQSWVRDTCGDLWLGFDQVDLSRWASDAGLMPGASLYIGLRNGFQIQVQQYFTTEPITAI
jgi:ArsR family transcriptional regulator